MSASLCRVLADSTRVVRFSASERRRIDEPGSVATGPKNVEVSGRFEPLGTAGTIDDGSWRVAGRVGTANPARPGPVRGRRRGGADGPTTWQGLAEGDEAELKVRSIPSQNGSIAGFQSRMGGRLGGEQRQKYQNSPRALDPQGARVAANTAIFIGHNYH